MSEEIDVFSAEDARNWVNKFDIQSAIDAIHLQIRGKAWNGMSMVAVHDYSFNSPATKGKEHLLKEHCKLIINILRAEGYSCTMRYDPLGEKATWLEINW